MTILLAHSRGSGTTALLFRSKRDGNSNAACTLQHARRAAAAQFGRSRAVGGRQARSPRPLTLPAPQEELALTGDKPIAAAA